MKAVLLSYCTRHQLQSSSGDEWSLQFIVAEYNHSVALTLLIFCLKANLFSFIFKMQPSAHVHVASSSVRTSDAFLTFGSVMEMTTAETDQMSRPTVSTCHVLSPTTNASPVDAFRCRGNAMETATVEKEIRAMNHLTAVSFLLCLWWGRVIFGDLVT